MENTFAIAASFYFRGSSSPCPHASVPSLAFVAADVHPWPPSIVRDPLTRGGASAFVYDLAAAWIYHPVAQRHLVDVIEHHERSALLRVAYIKPARHQQSAAPQRHLPVRRHVCNRQPIKDARNQNDVARGFEVQRLAPPRPLCEEDLTVPRLILMQPPLPHAARAV